MNILFDLSLFIASMALGALGAAGVTRWLERHDLTFWRHFWLGKDY